MDLTQIFRHKHDDEMDFAEVKGLENVKRALEIAAIGGHIVFVLWSNAPIFAESCGARWSLFSDFAYYEEPCN